MPAIAVAVVVGVLFFLGYRYYSSFLSERIYALDPAFAPDKRGYKKHCHFKVAVSRHCVRFLFEVGPEHADKTRWAAAWKKNAGKLAPVLRRVKGLAWFENEHDETPAAALAGRLQRVASAPG